MIDFWIDMVRTAGKYNAARVIFFEKRNHFLAFLAHVFAYIVKFCPCSINSFF